MMQVPVTIHVPLAGHWPVTGFRYLINIVPLVFRAKLEPLPRLFFSWLLVADEVIHHASSLALFRSSGRIDPNLDHGQMAD